MQSRIKKFVLTFTICGHMMAAYLLLGEQANQTLSFSQEANATPQRGTAAVNGSCSDTPITAFTPAMAYTIAFSAPNEDTAPTCTAPMTLTDGINGDTAPSIGCSITDVDGFVILSSRTPTMKISGLQCSTHDRSTLQVHGDGSDNVNMDIAVSTVGSTVWDGGKKVDAATSSSKIMLFGSGGQVGTSAIIDGQDNDALTNGEVAFGGTVASEGASRIYIKADFTNYDIQSATDQETLTFTFSMQ